MKLELTITLEKTDSIDDLEVLLNQLKVMDDVFTVTFKGDAIEI